MKITEKTAQLVADLEQVIGDNCYNGDSYNGWADEYGAHFRYPVYYPLTDGTYKKTRGPKIGIEYKNVDQMHYKFGANELYIGAGIIKLLNELEKRYGLDFNELTNENE